MKKILLFVAFSVGLSLAVVAQDSNLTVTSLVGTHVDTVLKQHLAGGGVLLSNGKFNNQTGNIPANYPQIGTFNRNGFTDFPFATGLVITTGNVSVAAGPNNSASAGSVVNPCYTEPALSPYTGGHPLTSCASLEFDFFAISDFFALNYIFASEEYCEYVTSSFNDAFAILLTGVDPVTYVTSTKNVAVIPGSVTADNPSGIPVSINNVNHGYHIGSPGPDFPNTDLFICNGGVTNGVQYDGYTTALSAGTPIFGCHSYHIKIAVCNVGDASFDSGVFLEEGSFYSPSVELNRLWENEPGGDTLVQGSHEQVSMAFKVERPLLTGYTSVSINAEGDAVLGVDYALINSDGDTMMITVDNNTFFFQSGDTVREVQVVMLPTIGFADSSQVKEARFFVTIQGCDGVPDLMEDFQKQDTVVLYFRLAEPEPDTTGIALRDLDSQWVVYPNPAGDYVTVDLKELSNEVREIALIDISGKVLRVMKPTGNPMRIELSDLPSGTYGILVRTQKGRTTRFFARQ